MSVRCNFIYRIHRGDIIPGMQCENLASLPSSRCYLHINRRVRAAVAIRPYYGVAMNCPNLEIVEEFVLSPQVLCSFCNAYMFIEEKVGRDDQNRPLFSLCCNKGQLSFIHKWPELPELLQQIIYNSPNSDFILNNIIAVNSVMSFASSVLIRDERLPNRGSYSISINGRSYHLLGDVPDDVERAKFGAIYYFPSDLQEQRRQELMPNLYEIARDELTSIQQLLMNVNPFARAYRQLREISQVRHNVGLRITSEVTVCEEVAALVENETDNNVVYLFLRNRTNNIRTRKLPVYCGIYDSLAYTLMLPLGSKGWDRFMRNPVNGKRISVNEFTRYQIMPGNNNQSLINLGKLYQQFVVDSFIKINGMRLHFIKTHQTELLAELYFNGSEGEQNIILPSSFTGSPRYLSEQYFDAMCLVNILGKPSLFITITANPNWTEIIRIGSGRRQNSVLNELIRVFQLKIKDFIDCVVKKQIFGQCRGYTYAVEFQKRGLPHAHFLLWIEQDFGDTIVIDKIIKAELPDETQLGLFDKVRRFMLHRNCTPDDICHQNSRRSCRFNFPKPFSNSTVLSDEGIIYKRRNSPAENNRIATYNPFLLQRYNCHVHAEVCNSNNPIKYIFKYVFKGNDGAVAEAEPADEVQRFIDGRYISASEALWRILNYSLNFNYPSVIALDIHLPDKNSLFNYDLPDGRRRRNSKLLDFFRLNNEFPNLNLLYVNLPKSFAWKTETQKWEHRTRGGESFGRLPIIQIRNEELFYLRLLLNHVTSPKSFVELRTVRGEILGTFKEAAEIRGLTISDSHLIQALEEACMQISPESLREMFSVILRHSHPSDPLNLWERFSEYFYDDYLIQGMSESEAKKKALSVIFQNCANNGLTLENISPNFQAYLRENITTDLLEEEYIPGISQTSIILTEEQRVVVNAVNVALDNPSSQKLFFISSKAGTGKTCLLNYLINYLRSRNEICLALATTGLAATLLLGGLTVHSEFCLPLDNVTQTLYLPRRKREKIRNCRVIIIDEATMLKKDHLEMIDLNLRNIMNNYLPFGGKIMILSGDWRQLLPVVKPTNYQLTKRSCLFESNLWVKFELLRLETVLRANDLEYTILLDYVSSFHELYDSFEVFVNLDLLVLENSLAELIKFVFPNLTSSMIFEGHILCPLKNEAEFINNHIIENFPGADTYIDSLDVPNDNSIFPVEYLHQLSPDGVPPHRLRLKIGTPVMLIRNLNVKKGLVNGTMLKVNYIGIRSLRVTVLTGISKGTQIAIPPIIFDCAAQQFRRFQVPVVPAFAITIHKSQGQTLERVGLYLKNNVFTHGQLYVALSRVRSSQCIKLLLHDSNIIFNEDCTISLKLTTTNFRYVQSYI